MSVIALLEAFLLLNEVYLEMHKEIWQKVLGETKNISRLLYDIVT